MLKLDVAKPFLHTSKQVRLVAMRAQRGDVAWQTSEAFCVQVNACIDVIAGAWTYEFQRSHSSTIACKEDSKWMVYSSVGNSSTHRLSAASLDASGVGPRPKASRCSSKNFVS